MPAVGTPGAAASTMWIWSLSPGFISRVWAFGSADALVISCGLGGPVGTPFVWMNAKLVVSLQLLLQLTKLNVHSASLMCSDAHHCVLLQLTFSMNGASPGG